MPKQHQKAPNASHTNYSHVKLQCKINYNDDQTVEEKHLAQEESVEKGEKENLLANAFAKLQNGEENVPGKKIVAMN